MNKRFFVIVVSMLLAALGIWLFSYQRPYHVLTVLNKKRDTPPLKENWRVNDHPAPRTLLPCGPDSFVYLTQAQQDYRFVGRRENAPDVERAKHEGADAKVTLRVVDARGEPVAAADVQVVFFYRGLYPINGKTDVNGFFTASHRSESDVQIHAMKEGYYRTHRAYWFYREGEPCAKNGRWQPWNPTLEVVLKEKRKPIPMFTKQIESKMPAQDVPIGYDFLRGDWVQPYGEGREADILLTYSESPRTNTWRRYDFIIAFSNKLDGAYLRKKDTYSQFVSAHEANPDGYQSLFPFVYERTNNKIIQERRITEDDILVFRVRTKTDDLGNITEAYYGKIYGPCKFADGPQRLVRIAYYFNPTPNDRNLEFDGENNLFNPGWRESWPREP
jgi:hypothetical protein